jgi:hypothetical protein
MSETLTCESVESALARLDGVVDALFELDLDRCADQEILAAWRAFETVRRRMEALDHRFVAQANQRSLAFANGCRSTAVLARQLLRIGPAEAAARVRAAGNLGPRVTLDGQPLEPIYPTVAAAQAEGAISAGHARVIVAAVEQLPAEIAVTHDRAVEAWLTGQAREWDPDQLAKHARDVVSALDPDGTLREGAERERNRHLRLSDRPDGSARLEAELTPECAERFRTLLTPLAKPAPSADGTKDPRTPGQRRHDAFHDLLKLLQRTGACPTANGVTATIVVHMDADAYATGHGTATTGFGYTVPASVAKKWAGLEARVIGVLMSRMKHILAYSSTHRIFTEQQRLALIARDKGCSFPGCDAPPQYCEAHHVTEYRESRRTSVDDAALLCTYHHDHFEVMGWRVQITDGLPTWTPPAWIDPDQHPVRNRMHDTLTPGDLGP